MILAISAFYAFVALSALWASRAAHSCRMPRAEQWHWLAVAAAFVLLIAVRQFGVEELLRDSLRQTLRAEGIYGVRREFQRPLTAIIIVVGAGFGLVAVLRFPGWSSRTRLAVWCARWATLGYIPLYCLRIVSLHATDVLLYRGPLRLNWLIDGGLAAVAGIAALAYALRLRQKAGPG